MPNFKLLLIDSSESKAISEEERRFLAKGQWQLRVAPYTGSLPLAYHDASWDAVIWHLEKSSDLKAALEEAYRLVVAEGTILLTVTLNVRDKAKAVRLAKALSSTAEMMTLADGKQLLRLQKLAAPLTEMECVSPDKKISSDITELHGKAEKISSNNNLLGHFDGIGECCATGWAFDKAAPQKPVSVQIIAEGRVIAQNQTAHLRADIKDLRVGFRIPIPARHFHKNKSSGIEVEARIAGSNYILPGGPHYLKLESRFSYFIDGFAERHIISGWLKDHADPNTHYLIELLEDEEIIVAARNDGIINENDDATGRFNFLIPEKLLNGEVHKFIFRVPELDWEIETRSYLLPLPTPSEDELRYPFVDYSIWKNTPAAIQANKTRTNASLLKTEVEKQIEFIEKEIKKTPEEDTIRRYDLICQIGYLLKQDNQSKNALGKFNQAIALDDMDPKAYGAYADILIANGQEIEAEAWLRKALKHLPEQPQLLSRLDKLLSTRRIKSAQIIAFYLPQFHPIPENDQWWGKGFTEWANVTAAVPLFHGHLQPRRPTALGYYDLRLPEIANAQFDLAKRYGIDAFCYYYYWFDGKRVLDRPLQDLVDGKTGPFPFCICWANEDWTRSWDGQSGEVLLAQNHSPESDFRFIQDIAPLLRHANYVRFDGKPILLIYRPDKLAEPQKTTQAWRDWCRKEGIGAYHLSVPHHGADPIEGG